VREGSQVCIVNWEAEVGTNAGWMRMQLGEWQGDGKKMVREAQRQSW
jgi:hypothetical protein